MTSRRLLLIITLCVTALTCVAQRPKMSFEPVKWKAEVIKDDGTYAIIGLTATIAQGWHLYDLKLPEGGPKPTTIEVKGVKLDGEITPSVKPVKVHDDMFGMDLTQWNSNVTFIIPVVRLLRGECRVEVKVTYMSCDGTNCRPPKTDILTLTLR